VDSLALPGGGKDLGELIAQSGHHAQALDQLFTL
jgi:hypothetical protein